jgi:hypothetical protein
MELLAEFKQYEKTIQLARAEYQKYEKIFLEDKLISEEEHAMLDKLANQIKHLEAVVGDKKLEQTILHVKKEIDRGAKKSTTEALALLGNTLSQVSAQSKQRAKTALEAIYAAIKATEQDGIAYSEEIPLFRIHQYSPSSKVQFHNLDLSSRAPYQGEWIRENAAYALFEDFSKVFSYRVNRIFKTPEWLGELLGLRENELDEYTGLRVRYRIKGETIFLHNWYGKYKYDFFKDRLLAVDFQGKGEDHFVLGAPFILEYGLFDHNGVLVGSFEEKGDKAIGIDIDSYTVLPEYSSGTF